MPTSSPIPRVGYYLGIVKKRPLPHSAASEAMETLRAAAVMKRFKLFASRFRNLSTKLHGLTCFEERTFAERCWSLSTISFNKWVPRITCVQSQRRAPGRSNVGYYMTDYRPSFRLNLSDNLLQNEWLRSRSLYIPSNQFLPWLPISSPWNVLRRQIRVSPNYYVFITLINQHSNPRKYHHLIAADLASWLHTSFRHSGCSY